MSRRVLHLRSSGGVLGAENVIIELGKKSPEFGYQSIIGAICNMGDPSPEFLNLARAQNIETVIFEAGRSFDPFLPGRIRQYINNNSIDLIHCHGYKEDFYGVLSLAKIPKVATNHLWKRTTIYSKIYALIDTLLLRFFDQVVGVSDEIVDEMRHYKIPRLIKIDNGVDVDRFQSTSRSSRLYNELGINADHVALGMVSSLTPEKGHTVAIQALSSVVRKFPSVKLLIVGDGYLKAEIDDQIRKYGLVDHVVILGSRKDIPEILSIIDIFLLPSFKEGLPMAMLEAMAAGKAVIATRVGENVNVISNRYNGLLIDPGEPSQLETAILELIYKKDLVQTLGINARKQIMDKYSSRSMTEKYCEVYTTMLGSHPKR